MNASSFVRWIVSLTQLTWVEIGQGSCTKNSFFSVLYAVVFVDFQIILLNFTYYFAAISDMIGEVLESPQKKLDFFCSKNFVLLVKNDAELVF